MYRCVDVSMCRCVATFSDGCPCPKRRPEPLSGPREGGTAAPLKPPRGHYICVCNVPTLHRYDITLNGRVDFFFYPLSPRPSFSPRPPFLDAPDGAPRKCRAGRGGCRPPLNPPAVVVGTYIHTT